MDVAYKVSNPITTARGQGRLARSSDPKDKLIADLINSHKSLDGRVSRIEAAAETASNTDLGFASGLPSLGELIRPRRRSGLLDPEALRTILSTAGGKTAKGDESEAEAAPAEQPAGPSEPNHGDDEEKES